MAQAERHAAAAGWAVRAAGLTGISQDGTPFAGVGSLLVDGPGTVQLNNIQNPFTGGITLGGTGILSLGHANSAGIGASKITFQSGAAATLQFSAGNAPSEAITGFEAGDTIELLGSSATYSLSDTFTYTAATKTLVVKTGAGAVLASLTIDQPTAGFHLSNVGGQEALLATAACYAEGTHIETPNGPVAIEALQPGMVVLTVSGSQRPVRWLGYRRLDITRHPRPHEVMPIRIEPGAFGEGLPLRPLVLSPGHGMPFDGTLVPIEYLVNGISIRTVPCDHVTYWHLELDAHDCVLAEGVPSESYLDCGNRSAFENGGAEMDLHPSFAAGPGTGTTDWPRAHDGPVVEAFRTQVLALLDARGAFTADPDLLVLADGQSLEPTGEGNFILRPGTRTIQLLSRAARPLDVLPGNDDRRTLGIMLRSLRLDGRAVALDDARLSAGWHAMEPGHRWSNGAATIDVAGAGRLAFDFHSLVRYHDVKSGEAARHALDSAIIR